MNTCDTRRIVMNNLRNVDLNLLVTLEALLTERNVTRAATRLRLSQPSVSVQLRKLREDLFRPVTLSRSGRNVFYGSWPRNYCSRYEPRSQRMTQILQPAKSFRSGSRTDDLAGGRL